MVAPLAVLLALVLFVVALVVVVIKMSAFSDISIEPGLYVFIAAVVASMLVVRRICHLASAIWTAPPDR